jgi:hypothetical protein
MRRPVFTLAVRAEPGVAKIRSLRAWLKIGLRTFGLRCLSIVQTTEKIMRVDLNKARQDDFVVLPDGVYALTITLKPGGAGDNDLLTKSKNGVFNLLVLELNFAGARFREWINVELNEHKVTDRSKLEDNRRAVIMGHKRVMQIVESAKAIDPADKSEAAEAQRDIDFQELDGMTFFAYVESRTYNGKQSNFVQRIISKDMPGWQEGIASMNGGKIMPLTKKQNQFDDEIPF